MATAAPSAAPLDTPIRPGSASGLRNSPCIATPHNASTAPTARPSKVRGIRIWPRISSACCRPSSSSGRPARRNAARTVSPSGRLTGPSASDSHKASASSRPSAINSERGLITAFMGWRQEAACGRGRRRRTVRRAQPEHAGRDRRPARSGRSPPGALRARPSSMPAPGYA